MANETYGRLREAVLEMAGDQRRLGVIYRKITMRHLGEEGCAAKPISGEEIRSLRERLISVRQFSPGT